MRKAGFSQRLIDLRSDTVTLPTEEMLEAIRNAELGDDVFREDPTVEKLQEMAAKKMGKEAALLVPSGTMANLVSVMSNTKRGDSIILEAESHIYWYEVGGISSIAGVLPIPVKGEFGFMRPKDIEEAIREKEIHTAETTLVCIENTHNRAGGTIITPSQIRDVSRAAKSHGLTLYMDGARIFNAAVALKTDVREFTKYVDNLMFCLSKGLSCPVGSIIVGDEEFIERARKIRKMIGGGMRQAGVIAAPGIIALEKMIDRLEEDHRNARKLAEGLAKIEGIYIDLRRVQTNIVIFDVRGLGVEAEKFVDNLRERGVLALKFGQTKVRMVTHRGVSSEDIDITLGAVDEVVKEFKR
ncbi:MAG: GntG family PLP-dependent aldolase [Nitrososphaerota archaeon]|nr:aminotransferase class I/II-fold pyridoxal phosphate-dependent enzyme [Candidatus Bathyarchaeota archaeon]MDW8048516.1 GntG family PLP-dependent aldolase [Nitrososphaerota archaeon]